METTTKQKKAIWIDQSQAILIDYYPNLPFGMEIINSPLESQVRFDGETSDKTLFNPLMGRGSNNEMKKNNIGENQLKQYLKAIENKLISADELLVMGPGIIKTQLLNHLKENKAFTSKRIQVESSKKMTTKQLLAKVKLHFGSSL